jgi:glyoxylase-like metal-dependent hydrolase (beta-lactamase superfamily II)
MLLLGLSKSNKSNCNVLNTHGHFDHVWSNQEVKDL